MYCHTAKQMRGSVTHERRNLRSLAIKAQRNYASGRVAMAKIPEVKAKVKQYEDDLMAHESTCSDCEKERREKNGSANAEGLS